MNPNDLLAQQQAYMNQVMQHAQHTQWAVLALWVASLLISVCVIYLFYARLRDIADELRKLRITFEMSEARKARTTSSPRQPASSPGEDRYMPKPGTS